MDALNPRTANRALPQRLLKPAEMAFFALVAGALMVFSAAQLNPLCLALSPVAVIFLVGYSYTKRFTWLCHFVLGLTDGIAPIAGWLAINPTISVANLVPPLLLGLMVAAWVIAVLSNSTAVGRVLHIRRRSRPEGNGRA